MGSLVRDREVVVGMTGWFRNAKSTRCGKCGNHVESASVTTFKSDYSVLKEKKKKNQYTPNAV